jgi:hypothetical protein
MALDELATVWLAADSALRQAITDATNVIDQALGTDPSDRPNPEKTTNGCCAVGGPDRS